MNKTTSALQRALSRLLRPLAKILLEQGLSIDEFTELAKRAYVEVAEQDFAIEGRKQSTTRIAVITGMHRKEVARLRKPDPAPPSLTLGKRITRVVSGWCNDADFCADGQPMPLSSEQFAKLVSRHSGNMTMRAVLDEMLRVNAVCQQDDSIELVNKVYVPRHCSAQQLDLVGEASADLLHTLSANIGTNTDNPGENRLQLSTVFDNLPAEIIPELKKMCAQRSHQLLSEIEQFLVQHDRDCNPDAPKGDGIRAGLGIYYIEDVAIPVQEESP
ncbi:MAG: DUF6502 family protein [Pseudomonadales bacterium]